ncbi:MAG: kelch repeat-containing protein [Planctomycetota bacterium]
MPRCAPYTVFALVVAIVPVPAQTWSPAPSPIAPTARHNHCAAYDITRSRLVVYGGHDANTVFADTWEHDGAAWQQGFPVTAPGPRWSASMAFDPVTATAVLFGGSLQSAGTPLAETWRWNGASWALLQPPQSPPARVAHAMVADLANARIVLFGGRNASGAEIGDTWTFDGTTWTQLPGPQPPARCCHDLAFDLNTNRVVLFGGWSGTSFGDTWELTGTTWVQRQPAASPAPRWGHRMAFDPGSGGVVLHGGAAPNPTAETWLWNGTTWQQLATSGPARANPVLHRDWARNRLVMFGGADALWAMQNDTWTFGAAIPGAFAPFGSGCAGPQGQPALTGPVAPTIGNTATVSAAATPLLGVFVLGLSNSSSGGVGLPLPLAAVGMPGCTLFVSLDVLVTRTPVGGAASLAIPVPYQPALVGGVFFVQTASLDLAANPLGLTISNALAGTIGWL